MREPDHGCRHDAEGQDYCYVDPGQCQGDDQQIGDHEQIIGSRRQVGCRYIYVAAECNVDSKRDQCCRYYYADVGAEFIGHLASLATGSGYGGVGNERQVVAEKCPTHHGGHKQCDIAAACAAGKLHNEWYECHYSSYRCAYRHADETSRHKYPGKDEC